ncbi:uncharacterized protein METZ01_LOCUS499564 [marine metagenome]|uniref:Uncharacterized protein n=1 Tax=marine metagenome TaxID=408172 RepID=A0A383DR36_9ZZZZ
MESESKQSAITRVYGLIVVIFNRRPKKTDEMVILKCYVRYRVKKKASIKPLKCLKGNR